VAGPLPRRTYVGRYDIGATVPELAGNRVARSGVIFFACASVSGSRRRVAPGDFPIALACVCGTQVVESAKRVRRRRALPHVIGVIAPLAVRLICGYQVWRRTLVVGDVCIPRSETGTQRSTFFPRPPFVPAVMFTARRSAAFIGAVRDLSKAFALAVPHAEALRIRDDVAFFQAIQSVLVKRTVADQRPEEELEHAVRQIISRAALPEGVVDIFAAAGLKKPDISVLSEEFLADVRGMPQRNLAVELLQKLLKGEIRRRGTRNVVQARSFAELLEQAVRKYQNRAIETAQVIEELIQLAKDMRAAGARGEQLGLSDDELAFYDALETNDSAVKVLGDDALRAIARELVETVRKNVTIDWTIRDNVRAQLRVLVKRILRKHGYPRSPHRTSSLQLAQSSCAACPRAAKGCRAGFRHR
jgi:hypothetical protein